MAGRPPTLLPAAQEFGMEAMAAVWDARSALQRRDVPRAVRLLGVADESLRRQQRALRRLERSAAKRRQP